MCNACFQLIILQMLQVWWHEKGAWVAKCLEHLSWVSLLFHHSLITLGQNCMYMSGEFLGDNNGCSLNLNIKYDLKVAFGTCTLYHLVISFKWWSSGWQWHQVSCKNRWLLKGFRPKYMYPTRTSWQTNNAPVTLPWPMNQNRPILRIPGHQG